MRNNAAPERAPYAAGERDGIPLDDQVNVGPMGHTQQRIPHRAADEADAGGVSRKLHAGEHGIAVNPLPHDARIPLMSDHVAGNLSASAPIALEGLAAAIARWEGRSLDELQAASDRIRDEVRGWAEDPSNADRPISDSPVYLDRMAVEVLIERRFFTE